MMNMTLSRTKKVLEDEEQTKELEMEVFRWRFRDIQTLKETPCNDQPNVMQLATPIPKIWTILKVHQGLMPT